MFHIKDHKNTIVASTLDWDTAKKLTSQIDCNETQIFYKYTTSEGSTTRDIWNNINGVWISKKTGIEKC